MPHKSLQIIHLSDCKSSAIIFSLLNSGSKGTLRNATSSSLRPHQCLVFTLCIVEVKAGKINLFEFVHSIITQGLGEACRKYQFYLMICKVVRSRRNGTG